MICLAFMFIVPSHADALVTFGIDYNNGVVTLSFNQPVSGTARLVLYDGAAPVFQTSMGVSGTTAQIGLSVRNLQLKNYNASVVFQDDDGNIIGPETLSIQTGVSSPVSTYTQGDEIILQTPRMSRAIMQPYAKVYSNSGMTGTPLVELKRHDFVQVIRDLGNVAYVKYFIQSGNGTYQYQSGYNDINGNHVASGVTYSSDDDLTGYGYIYTSAFSLPLTSEETDVAREAVELAYSRLGNKGIYNQMMRYIEYYTDCSAFVSYCYYNASIDFGENTSCNGIINWANSQNENVILWDAGINPYAGSFSLSSHALVHASGGVDKEGNPYPIVPDLKLHTSTDTNLTLSDLVSYQRTVDSNVISQLKAGDLLFFNHKQTVYDQFGCNLGNWQVVEYAEGLDHVAMVVGTKGNTVTYIHSTPSAANPENGVVMVTATIDDLANVVKIVRPTGCEEIDPPPELNLNSYNVSSSQGAQIVYSFLINDMGLNPAAACGIMANIQCESLFIADKTEVATGIGYGLCQWSFGRRTNLVNWCRDNGYDYRSYEGQLQFLMHELEGSYSYVLDKLKNVSNTAQGAYDAASIWCKEFERPQDMYNEAARRGSIARDNYWPIYGEGV